MKKILSLLIITLFIGAAGYARTTNFPDTTGFYQYIGDYKFPEGSFVDSVNISFSDSVLVGSSTQGSTTLTKLGVDSFKLDNYDGTLVFKRDESNNVKTMILEVDGNTIIGEKISVNEQVLIRKEQMFADKPSDKS